MQACLRFMRMQYAIHVSGTLTIHANGTFAIHSKQATQVRVEHLYLRIILFRNAIVKKGFFYQAVGRKKSFRFRI